jgi:hypothetical protein
MRLFYPLKIMGYYTKLNLSFQLSKDAPLEFLEKLCNGELEKELFEAVGINLECHSVADTPNLPIDHPFGKTHRWTQIFNGAIFNKSRKTLKIKCEIKTYENDYEKLVDWLKPYIISGKAKYKGEDLDFWINLLN